jgi:hypothetical protein
MVKNKIKKGADPGIILELLSDESIKKLEKTLRLEEIKKRYSAYFGKTSKETIKANVREDIIIKNQKNRFLVKLPQDLKKLDIMAANLNEEKDIIEITFSQQKGNNASFNSSSESKTLESISECIITGSYKEFFDLLPDELNPNKNGKKFIVDVCVGMINACGFNVKKQGGVEIKYLTNDDYLLHLGLEINIVQLAIQIEQHEKIVNHTYDAVFECCNWYEIYDKCIKELNYD